MVCVDEDETTAHIFTDIEMHACDYDALMVCVEEAVVNIRTLHRVG